MLAARRSPRCGVQREIDQQILRPVDEESTERTRVVHPLDMPATLTSSREELIPGQHDIAGIRAGEEIQVLRRSRRETLHQQRRSPGQQKPAACRQAEEQLRDLHLELGQPALRAFPRHATTGTADPPRT